MHYLTFWKNAKVIGSLEKLAASDDAAISKEAQVLLSAACDNVFAQVKQASDVVSAALSFRAAHETTGEKVASDAAGVATLLQKLATAEHVDAHISAQLEKLSGAEYDSARAVQLLGREYAVQLMRGLLA